jgi:hypothetical protein
MLDSCQHKPQEDFELIHSQQLLHLHLYVNY